MLALTLRAPPASRLHPRNADAIADAQRADARTELVDDAHRLVPEDDGKLHREMPMDRVHVGAAQSARAHAQSDLARAGLRVGERVDLQRRVRCDEDGCAHGTSWRECDAYR